MSELAGRVRVTDVRFLAALMAKPLLIIELAAIPEFDTLWRTARRHLDSLLPQCMEDLRALATALSPEARGAVLLKNPAGLGYTEWAVREAEKFRERLGRWMEEMATALECPYHEKLWELVQPLGIPDLHIWMETYDLLDRGFVDIHYESGPIEGPFAQLLQVSLLKAWTNLDPIEAAMKPPGAVRAAARRKWAPVSRSLHRYDIQGRIKLWVLNKVYGITFSEIAERPTPQLGRWCAEDRIKRRIQEATQLLGATVPSGRPRKGGALRVWKMGV